MRRSGKQSGIGLDDLQAVDAVDRYVRPGGKIRSLAVAAGQRDRFFSGIEPLKSLHTKEVSQNPLIAEAGAPENPEYHQQGELFIAPEVMRLVLLEFIERQSANPKYDTRHIYLITESVFSELNQDHKLVQLLKSLKERLALGQTAKIILYLGVHAHFIYFERRENRDFIYLIDSEGESRAFSRPLQEIFPNDDISYFAKNLQIDFYSCATIAFKILRFFCKLKSLGFSLDQKEAIERQLLKYSQRRIDEGTVFRSGEEVSLADYQAERKVEGEYDATHLLSKYRYLARANHFKSRHQAESVKALSLMLSHLKGPDFIQFFFRFHQLSKPETDQTLNLEKYLRSKQEQEKFNEQDFQFFLSVLGVLFKDELSAIEYCESVLAAWGKSDQPLHDVLILVPSSVLAWAKDGKELARARAYCNLDYGSFAPFLLSSLDGLVKIKQSGIGALVAKLLMKPPQYRRAKENPQAAHLFSEHGISETVFDLYLALKPSAELPFKTQLTSSGLQVGFVAKRDPLAALLGNLTGCCQRLDGLAKTAVEYGIENPNGGFIGVFNEQGKLVAQAFVYLRKAADYVKNIVTGESIALNQVLVIDSLEVSHAEALSDKAKEKLAEVLLDFFRVLLAEYPNLEGIFVGKVHHEVFAKYAKNLKLKKRWFYFEECFSARFSPVLPSTAASVAAEALPLSSDDSNEECFYTDFTEPEFFLAPRTLYHVYYKCFILVWNFSFADTGSTLEAILRELLGFERYREKFQFEAGKTLELARSVLDLELANPLPLCRIKPQEGEVFFEQDRTEVHKLFLNLIREYYFPSASQWGQKDFSDLINFFARIDWWGFYYGFLSKKELLLSILQGLSSSLAGENRHLAMQVFFHLYQPIFSSEGWRLLNQEEFAAAKQQFLMLERGLDKKQMVAYREGKISTTELRSELSHLDHLLEYEHIFEQMRSLEEFCAAKAPSLFSEDPLAAEARALISAYKANILQENKMSEFSAFIKAAREAISRRCSQGPIAS